MYNFSIKKNQRLHFIVLALLWVLALVTIRPFGNFPLYDDWCFARTLKILYEQHRYEYTGFTISNFLPLVSHYLLGYISCIPLGFSNIMLRISTIALSMIGVFYFYYLLKNIFDETIAFIGSLVLAFNPLYFILSYSYMSDIPFLVYTIISLHYFVKYFKTEKKSAIVLAILFSILATLTRQLGVLLPLAMVFISFLNPRRSKKQIALILGSLILNIGLFLLAQRIFMWLQNDFKVGSGFGILLQTIKGYSLETFFSRYSFTIFIISICILPFQFYLLPKVEFSFRTCLIAFILFVPLVLYPKYMMGTYINNFYLGPLTTKDVYGFRVMEVLSSNRLYTFLVIIGLFSSYLFVLELLIFMQSFIHKLYKTRTISLTDAIKIGTFVYIFSYLILYFTFKGVCDRYLLPIIVFTIIFILKVEQNKLRIFQKGLIIISISALILYSILGTHDYFALQTTRWKAVNYLLNDKKISPHEMDAGYEPNGWYNYSYPIRLNPNKSWWYVDDDKYVVGLTHLAGYDIIKEYTFSKWIHKYANTLYVLKRSDNIETLNPQSFIDFETVNSDSTGFIVSNQIVDLQKKEQISHVSHTGKNALVITKTTMDNVLFTLEDIKADDYCEMTYWIHSPKPNTCVRIKSFTAQSDYWVECIKQENGWKEYKCSFFASSWISDMANKLQFIIIPKDDSAIIVDDIRLIKIHRK